MLLKRLLWPSRMNTALSVKNAPQTSFEHGRYLSHQQTFVSQHLVIELGGTDHDTTFVGEAFAWINIFQSMYLTYGCNISERQEKAAGYQGQSHS